MTKVNIMRRGEGVPDANIIQWTNNTGGAVAAWSTVAVLGGLGVVMVALASGETGSVIVGPNAKFEGLKVTGALAQGDLLYKDTGTGKWTGTATGNRPGAICTVAAASGDERVGLVLLPPQAVGTAVRAGQHTTVAASDTVATGLSLVTSAIAVLDSDPGDDPMLVSCSIGDQAGSPAAGSILIKTWKNTGGTDPTPVAASTFSKKVNWIAFGTA